MSDGHSRIGIYLLFSILARPSQYIQVFEPFKVKQRLGKKTLKHTTGFIKLENWPFQDLIHICWQEVQDNRGHPCFVIVCVPRIVVSPQMFI